MRICIDIDGVICHFKQPGQSYADVEPIAGASEKIREFKTAGHTIILYTGRHMKTCNGNVGMVIARQGKVTLDWLERHDIPFDELHFGKPYADVYIDDNALRFSNWQAFSGDHFSIPVSNENSQSQPLTPE